MRVLVSNNSELLRHLGTASFRSVAFDVTVVTGGGEALELAARDRPVLCLLDAEMADLSGYEVARRIKLDDPTCRIVLVLGGRINAQQLRLVSESTCDEILIAPMQADQLYDVVAFQLGLPRRGARRFSIGMAVVGRDGERNVRGRVTNLSIDGARIVLEEPIAEGSRLRLDISPEGEASIAIEARVVWAQRQGNGTVVGASFEGMADDVRRQLARLTQWEIVQDTERTRVVVKGDITETTRFDDLLPALVGRVDFDLSQIGYMNSLGVREWVELLRKAPIQGYEFHACSVAFVLQASLVEGVLGRGTVSSFFAPYACETCEATEERLLQSAAVLAAGGRPPPFACQACGGNLVLDDIPDRYLAFLRGGPGVDG